VAWVIFFERSSTAPAQPTSRTGTRMSARVGVPGCSTGMSKSSFSVHSSRLDWPTPHGSPAFSTLRSITPASWGKLDSIIAL
jgi:hypothetical protein